MERWHPIPISLCVALVLARTPDAVEHALQDIGAEVLTLHLAQTTGAHTVPGCRALGSLVGMDKNRAAARKRHALAFLDDFREKREPTDHGVDPFAEGPVDRCTLREQLAAAQAELARERSVRQLAEDRAARAERLAAALSEQLAEADRARLAAEQRAAAAQDVAELLDRQLAAAGQAADGPGTGDGQIEDARRTGRGRIRDTPRTPHGQGLSSEMPMDAGSIWLDPDASRTAWGRLTDGPGTDQGRGRAGTVPATRAPLPLKEKEKAESYSESERAPVPPRAGRTAEVLQLPEPSRSPAPAGPEPSPVGQVPAPGPSWRARDVRAAWSAAWQDCGGKGRGPDDGKNGRIAGELARELSDDNSLGSVGHEDLAAAFRLYLIEHREGRLHWRGAPSLYTLSCSGGLSAWLTRALQRSEAADDDPDLASWDQAAEEPPELRAELEAAQAALDAGEPGHLSPEVLGWLNAHPDHPGNATMHALIEAKMRRFEPLSAK